MQRILIDPEPTQCIAVEKITQDDIIAFTQSRNVYILTVKDADICQNELTTGTWFWSDLRCRNGFNHPNASAVEAIKWMIKTNKVSVYRFANYKEFAQWILTLDY